MSVATLPVHSGRGERDGQLVEALRYGEAGAAERLVRTYQGRAYRLAIGITGNPEDAEEVVQDAFWAAIRKIDTFRGEAAFGSWLYRIVVNGACNRIRSRRAQPMELTLDDVLPGFDGNGRHAAPVADWSASVDAPSCRAELRLAVGAAIRELPVRYRAALVLRDVEGLSTAEVAAALGLTLSNAKNRIHRARLFVRKRLTESPSLRRLA